MDPLMADLFRNFLKEEVIKGNTSGPKKVIGTKVVYVTKLLNDLAFWAEVERLVDLIKLYECLLISQWGTSIISLVESLVFV